MAAATHLIGGFNLSQTHDGLAAGKVTWFHGNTRGCKAPDGVELGPENLGTEPRGFWTRLEDDLKQSMRIDRQKYFNNQGSRFCDYALQVDDQTIACVLVRVNVVVGVGVMRRAFNLILESAMNVAIDPTDPTRSYMHVAQGRR